MLPVCHTCPANQDIPEYMYLTSEGRFDDAFRTILRTNPFPTVTGMACDHLCQTKCTRMNYEESLQIREVKRFISGTNHRKTRSGNISIQWIEKLPFSALVPPGCPVPGFFVFPALKWMFLKKEFMPEAWSPR